MDFDRCVAHHIQGRHKGQRCKKKGTVSMFENTEAKVCADHRGHYYVQWSTPTWMREIVERGVLGRYNNA